ncbi:MAG: adenine methyltransferase [Acidobacteriales bacterium]|nr:adenine methyltransferase [Terriglobales bacterium]
MIGPISYIGGKNRLAAEIISRIPEHVTYVEPFAGGAQVLFHKEPSKVEILNDLSHEIVNFFRICQSHHDELIRYLKYMIVGRNWFDQLYKADPSILTDIQKAARFLYLQKTAYAGLVARKNFALHVIQNPHFNADRIPHLIEKAHERLKRVQIESLPYEQVISKTDRATTFFYLDPPYWEKKLYHFNFTKDDFVAMEKRLRAIKGKFLLSINDVPEIRSLFRNFKIETVQLSYTAQKKVGVRFKELLISNY